ncbi:MAG: O-antigen ligase family protein [Thermovirgaceae bacterium]
MLFWSLFSTLINFHGWYDAAKGFSIPVEAFFGVLVATLVFSRKGAARLERVWWVSSAVVFAWTLVTVMKADDFAGPFHNVNTLGLYAVMTLPMSYSLVAQIRTRRKIFLSWLLVAANVLTLIFSFSLGAWVVGVFETVCFLLLVRPSFKGLVKAAAATSLVVALLFSALTVSNPKVLSHAGREVKQLLSFSEDLSRFTNKRSVIWRATLDLSLEKPLTGWGWLEFRTLVKEVRGKIKGIGIPMEPHNMYLELFVTGGIPLLVGGIGLIALGGRSALKKMKASGERGRCLYAAVFTTIAAIMFYGIGGSIFAARHKVGFLFWVLFGIAAAREKGGSSAGGKETGAAPETC